MSFYQNQCAFSSDEEAMDDSSRVMSYKSHSSRHSHSGKVKDPYSISREFDVDLTFEGEDLSLEGKSGHSNLNRGDVGHGDKVPISLLECERSGGVQGEEVECKVKGRRVRGQKGGGGDLRWFAGIRLWHMACVGCVLGLLFGIQYRYRGGLLSRVNVLRCPQGIDRPCLSSSELKTVLHMADILIPYLHTRAGEYECLKQPVAHVAVNDLKRMLPKGYDSNENMKNFLFFVVHNPHLNIVWLDILGNTISPHEWIPHQTPSGSLKSTSPSHSITCFFHKLICTIWSKLKMIILVVVVFLILLGVITHYHQKRRILERNKFLIIDKILSVLSKHHRTSQLKRNLLPYLAIIHVRDMLIPPSERFGSKLKIWEEACTWIAKYESRVRVERQRIAGEDFDVWKWIQEDPPVTEEPLLTKEAIDVMSSTLSSTARKKNWYNGTTFDDETGRNTGRNSRINLPYGTPSPCIRLKNMFEPIKHMTDEQSKEIEDSVLDRCVAHGGVVHIYVDRRSPYGCVYFKMERKESAVEAYKALHGGWYKGKLVTAKYLPLEKYYKWFPAAATAKVHLHPSS